LIGALRNNMFTYGTNSIEIAIIDIVKDTSIIIKTNLFTKIFHAINTYVDKNVLVYDFIGNKNADIFAPFDIVNIAIENLSSAMYRFTYDFTTELYSLIEIFENLELPFFNPNYKEKKYDVFYSIIYCKQNININETMTVITLAKNTISTQEQIIWYDDNNDIIIVSEPIFIPNPNGTTEDDGVVMANIYSNNKQTSYMIFLDGVTFKEITRTYLNGKVPFITHGNFFN